MLPCIDIAIYFLWITLNRVFFVVFFIFLVDINLSFIGFSTDMYKYPFICAVTKAFILITNNAPQKPSDSI